MRVDKFRLDCFLQVVCLNWVSKLVAGRSYISRDRSGNILDNLVSAFLPICGVSEPKHLLLF